MANSKQIDVPSDDDQENRSRAGAHFWYNIRAPLLASVFVAPMFVWPLFLDLGPTETTEAKSDANAAAAQACAEWEDASLDALNKRMDSPETGRETFESVATHWLNEARRQCAHGSPARAATYYQRIITTATAEMASAAR